MTTIQDLTSVLKKLRLSGVLETMELRERQASDDNLTNRDFLFHVLNDEVERREAKQLHLRLRRAAFDSQRTIEDFDFTYNPQIPKAKVVDLATCHFVERHENVLLVGPTGVGKSHLAQALGHRACRAGYSVLYIAAHEMLTKLRASRAVTDRPMRATPVRPNGATASSAKRSQASSAERSHPGSAERSHS